MGPPLTGHGWSGDSARYVPRQAITPVSGNTTAAHDHKDSRPEQSFDAVATAALDGSKLVRELNAADVPVDRLSSHTRLIVFGARPHRPRSTATRRANA